MHDFISDIIRRFGGRLAGSLEEDHAQDHMLSLLAAFCDTARKQSFRVPVTSMHESLKIFCAGFWLALFLYRVSLPAAFIVSLANAVLFVGHFLTYRFWLDPLFKRSWSSNVEGVIEPRQEVKATLIFAGHMDSTTEYQWWYTLKNFGGFLTWLSGFLITLLPLFYLLALAVSQAAWKNAVWDIFSVLSPATFSLFFMRSNRVVPGAQDNLSGVAIAMGAAMALAGEDAGSAQNGKRVPLLSHTRIKVLSFGSEEPGLRGSAAYVHAFRQDLLQENAVLINADGIMRTRDLRVVRGELTSLVRYPESLVQRLQTAFAECSQPARPVYLPIGATDAASFAMRGLPAVSIVGLPTGKLDPAYHTRLDTPDAVDPQALEKVKDILVRFAVQWDKDLASR